MFISFTCEFHPLPLNSHYDGTPFLFVFITVDVFNLPSVVTGKGISMQAADCAFRNGGLPGPQRLTLETSALERRFPELQL